MSSVNLNELRDKAYQCAVAHGWHEQEYSNEHFLCLVISELMEAVEADRKGITSCDVRFNKDMEYLIREFKIYGEGYDKAFIEIFNRCIKDSVEEELADACIRLLDLAGLRDVDLNKADIDNFKCSEDLFDCTFTESIYSFVCDIADLGYINGHSFDSYIRVVLMTIMSFCVRKDIDIFWHIEQKMKYNELRPYKHADKSY